MILAGPFLFQISSLLSLPVILIQLSKDYPVFFESTFALEFAIDFLLEFTEHLMGRSLVFLARNPWIINLKQLVLNLVSLFVSMRKVEDNLI